MALLRAAASFLPRSSADAAFISQTCRRTPHESLCVSLLQSNKGSSTATTVWDLAVAALGGARRATLRAKLRALDLIHDGTPKGTAELELLARCDALYSECLRASAKVAAMVSTGTYGGAADAAAAAALRGYGEKCEGLFAAKRIASPLQKENREMVEKLGVSYEIIRLLR